MRDSSKGLYRVRLSVSFVITGIILYWFSGKYCIKGMMATAILFLQALCWLISLVLGVSSARLSCRRYRRVGLSGALLSAVLLILFALTPYINLMTTAPSRERGLCKQKLLVLYEYFREYTEENGGRIPKTKTWCDAIVRKHDTKSDPFICPTINISQRLCSYGLNEHILGKQFSELPRDIVFLFEMNLGWNQTGGPNDLNFDNHDYILETTRCGILYANGDIEYVQKKNANGLRWNP